MKKILTITVLAGVLLVFLIVGSAFSNKSFQEKLWISGKITGSIRGHVISLQLVDTHSNTVQMETSVNKFGWYAFSDMGQGSPSNFKLVIFKGNDRVKEVSLSGVKSGGRVPDIHIP